MFHNSLPCFAAKAVGNTEHLETAAAAAKKRNFKGLILMDG